MNDRIMHGMEQCTPKERNSRKNRIECEGSGLIRVWGRTLV